jgi:alginate O-acetyltransferase complex protein AlgI
MLFLTYWFVTFACITLPVYWLVGWPRLRLVLLFLCCVAFHTHFAGPAGVVPIIVLATLTYLAGLTRRSGPCVAGIVLSVLFLLFYKYTRFLCLDILYRCWPHAGMSIFKHLHAHMPESPPLAISFFVFEFIHYLYDVKKGTPPIRSPLDFGLFAIFWPSIVAGPVKRCQQFVPELHRGVRSVCSTDIAIGLILVASGLLKKFVADNLTAYTSAYDPLFASLSRSSRWCVFAALALRILFDFSGYSDLAIGFARMVGIRLPANFNWPYLATNLVDFWHRWHISLSLWIRDYIYIPLGGNRRGPLRRVGNGLLAFALCGLWHGAAWNFVFWGLYHGIGLAVNSHYRTLLGRPGAVLSRWFAAFRPAGLALTLGFVSVGWLFFFHPVPVAFRMLRLLLVRS